jgi:sugar phosphate permease
VRREEKRIGKIEISKEIGYEQQRPGLGGIKKKKVTQSEPWARCVFLEHRPNQSNIFPKRNAMTSGTTEPSPSFDPVGSSKRSSPPPASSVAMTPPQDYPLKDSSFPPSKTPASLGFILAPFPLPSKTMIFILTFMSYVMMKSANKSFSLVQPILVKQEFFSSSIYSSDSSGQTEMIGLISTLFLSVYAFGQFFVGTLADRFDLRYFLSGAMIFAGIFSILFSVCGYLQYRQLWVYCLLWSFNGLAQACGWPSNLSIMNNWFGKKSRGFIFSAWSSNSNLGNVLGAVICGIVFAIYPHDATIWQFSMLICGLGAIAGALPIFLCLVPKPYDYESLPSSSASSETDVPTAHPSGSRPEPGKLMRFTSSVFPHQRSPAPVVSSAEPKQSKQQHIQQVEMTEVQEFESQLAQQQNRNQEFALLEVEEDHDMDEPRIQQPSTSSFKLKSSQILPMEVIEGDVENHIPPLQVTVKPTPSSSPSSPSVISSYLRVLTLGLCTRGVVPYMIIYACTKGVVYVFMYWMPLFLTSSKGISNSSAAILSALFDVGGFLGGISSGHITDIIGSRTLVLILMTSASLVVTWMLFNSAVDQAWLIALSLFLIGVSIGGVQVLISASVALDLGDSAVEKKIDPEVEVPETNDGQQKEDQDRDMQPNPSADEDSQKPSSGLAGTISGLIEGSGSAGAAVLQYLVGQLVTCTQQKDGDDASGADDDGDNVVCSWHAILVVITVSILLSLTCLLYIKFSNSLIQIWRRSSWSSSPVSRMTAA